MSTVRNYQHYECPAIGIVNGVKMLRNWKKVFDLVLEELHYSVKEIGTQKIIGC